MWIAIGMIAAALLIVAVGVCVILENFAASDERTQSLVAELESEEYDYAKRGVAE